IRPRCAFFQGARHITVTGQRDVTLPRLPDLRRQPLADRQSDVLLLDPADADRTRVPAPVSRIDHDLEPCVAVPPGVEAGAEPRRRQLGATHAALAGLSPALKLLAGPSAIASSLRSSQ